MAVILTDEQIATLIAEPKTLPDFSKLETRPKRGHKERDVAIPRAEGGGFYVILRESSFCDSDTKIRPLAESRQH